MGTAATLLPVCPAVADAFEGVAPGLGGIRCGVLRRDAELRDLMTTGADTSVLTLREDPSTVLNHCCGNALPVEPEVTATERLGSDAADDPDDTTSRHAHYTNCLIWQLHIERSRFADEDDLGLDGEVVGQKRAQLADSYGTVDPKLAEKVADEVERNPELAIGTAPESLTSQEMGELTGWTEDPA